MVVVVQPHLVEVTTQVAPLLPVFTINTNTYTPPLLAAHTTSTPPYLASPPLAPLPRTLPPHPDKAPPPGTTTTPGRGLTRKATTEPKLDPKRPTLRDPQSLVRPDLPRPTLGLTLGELGLEVEWKDSLEYHWRGKTNTPRMEEAPKVETM